MKKLYSSWDRDQIGIKSGTNILYTKSLQIFGRKAIYMLTGLKVSYMPCKYLFYRPEHDCMIQRGEPVKLNVEVLEVQN